MNVPAGTSRWPAEHARDPGLQPERTSLAWRRTLLALVVIDFLLLRAWTLAAANDGDRPGGALGLGIAVVAAAVATVLIAFCALSRARALRRRTDSAPAHLAKTATAATVLLAVAVVAAILLAK